MCKDCVIRSHNNSGLIHITMTNEATEDYVEVLQKEGRMPQLNVEIDVGLAVAIDRFIRVNSDEKFWGISRRRMLHGNCSNCLAIGPNGECCGHCYQEYYESQQQGRRREFPYYRCHGFRYNYELVIFNPKFVSKYYHVNTDPVPPVKFVSVRRLRHDVTEHRSDMFFMEYRSRNNLRGPDPKKTIKYMCIDLASEGQEYLRVQDSSRDYCDWNNPPDREYTGEDEQGPIRPRRPLSAPKKKSLETDEGETKMPAKKMKG